MRFNKSQFEIRNMAKEGGKQSLAETHHIYYHDEHARDTVISQNIWLVNTSCELLQMLIHTAYAMRKWNKTQSTKWNQRKRERVKWPINKTEWNEMVQCLFEHFWIFEHPNVRFMIDHLSFLRDIKKRKKNTTNGTRCIFVCIRDLSLPQSHSLFLSLCSGRSPSLSLCP